MKYVGPQHIIFAPHLDDEVIGCYSIWNKIDIVVYFTRDYREKIIQDIVHLDEDSMLPDYIFIDDFALLYIEPEDTIYLPSKFDFHPLHKHVRNIGLGFNCKKIFYSIEMNVPWLEEENDSKGKLELLKYLYPKEDLFLTNAKYYLFKSIKEYDNIVYKRVFHTFDLNYKLYIQQFSEGESFADVDQIVRELKRGITYKSNIDFYNSLQNVLPNRLIKIITNESIIE